MKLAMKKFALLILVTINSFIAKAQSINLSDIIKTQFYKNVVSTTNKQDTIIYILNDRNDFVVKRDKNIERNFDLILFDREALFLDFLKKKKECLLVRLEKIESNVEPLRLMISLNRTNYEAYTNPTGSIMREIEEKIIVLKLNQKKCAWELIN